MAYKVGNCLLRRLLADTGMSQTDLANRLNVSKQQVNKYVMNNRVMSLEVSKNVSEILNCRIDDLYEWIEVGENE